MRRHLPSVPLFRNFIFGVEDSLVSTVGLLSGIALAGVPAETIFLTGVVLIFVEAFSMAAGSFLSESSAGEYANKEQRNGNDLLVALTMFSSYFLSGFIPLFPYLVWPTETAATISVIASIAALFVLGLIGAAFSRTGYLRGGMRMAIIGGVAIAVGTIAGSIVSRF